MSWWFGCLNADEQPAAMQRGNPASSFNHPLLAGWIALSVCLIHRYLAPPAALLAWWWETTLYTSLDLKKKRNPSRINGLDCSYVLVYAVFLHTIPHLLLISRQKHLNDSTNSKSLQSSPFILRFIPIIYIHTV